MSGRSSFEPPPRGFIYTPSGKLVCARATPPYRSMNYANPSPAASNWFLKLPGGVEQAPKRAGVVIIEELAACTDEELLSLYGIGPKALRVIRSRLCQYRANYGRVYGKEMPDGR